MASADTGMSQDQMDHHGAVMNQSVAEEAMVMDVTLDRTGSTHDRIHNGDHEAATLVGLEVPRAGEHALGVLQGLSASVCRAPELAAGLDGVLDRLLRLTQAVTGTIHVVSDDGGLQLVATRGLSDRFRHLECQIPHGACVCGRSVLGDESVVVDDLAGDVRLERPACVDEGIHALVAVPCRSGGRTLGLLTLYSKYRSAFAGLDRALLRAIGMHLGAAIDTAEYLALSRERAVADERRVIAGELHDGVAQTLAYLNLQVARVQVLLDGGATDGASRELAEVRGVIQDAYSEVRHLLADFRATPVGDPGAFAAALRVQTEAFTRRTGIAVDLAGDAHLAALSVGQQAEMFRIIQEALANVRKHAGASTVRIVCEGGDGRCVVRVTDDGVGFDPALVEDTGGLHVGTSIIRERAAKLRGRLTIDSQPGRGTTVSVSVPLSVAEERSFS
jgi:two-component system nitrate/nitrite sensor histidine kinase NarX